MRNDGYQGLTVFIILKSMMRRWQKVLLMGTQIDRQAEFSIWSDLLEGH